MSKAPALVLWMAISTAALPGAVRADDPAPPPSVAGEIPWKTTVAEAFEAGKKEGKPILIAINAAKVDGGVPEPAGKELREHVYVDPSVVAKAAAFVCVLLRPDGSSGDFAELRQRFSIDGQIVSPQHIFAYSDGTLIERREYWSYRAGQESVDALLGMMDKALAAQRLKSGLPAEPPATAPGAGPSAPPAPGRPGEPPAPPAQDPRQAWIRSMLDRVRAGSADAAARDAAITELIKGDRKGDCIEPLSALLPDLKKDPDTQVAILKALGKPGLEIVVPVVSSLLDDRNDDVRSNAAVTLEYVGSAKAVEALTKRVGKDHSEEIANNVLRALGRCGAKQEPVRKVLLREAGSAKSPREFAGPVIGLAYFEKDAEAARALEKMLKKEGDRTKRAFLLWALSEIADPKSSDFIRKEILPNEKDLRVSAFVRACAEVCSGSDDGTAKGTVEGGMGFMMGFVGSLGGTARRNRDQSEFKPKGEFAPGPGRGGNGQPPGGGKPPPPGMGG